MLSRAVGAGRPEAAYLAGHIATRLVVVIGGLAIFSLGIMLTLQSRVGLGPWDVFHQGLAKQLGLAFGTASLLVGFFVLLLAWVLGARPGVASVLNMLL